MTSETIITRWVAIILLEAELELFLYNLVWNDFYVNFHII